MKYDYYGQLIFFILLVLVSLFSIIPGNGAFFLVALVGLFPLGVWQLISAAINSFRFKNDKRKFKFLKLYWFLALMSLLLFFISLEFSPLFENQQAMVGPLVFAAMFGLVLVAVYYLFIYKKFLIDYEHQEDISTRSIH